jgi:small conductance mechanosensitive channel
MDFNETLQSVVDKLEGWLEGLILMLPNLVAAVLVVLVFALLARLARRVLQRVMERFSPYTQVNRLIATFGYVAVLAAGVLIALGLLNLDDTVTTFLAGAGIIGLALGFAFQDIATNFISGILLSIRRPFTEDDLIETNDFFGRVEEINLRSTHVRTFQGQIAIIPNSSVFQNPVVNYSKLGQRRIDLSCGVAYGDDLERARQLALQAVEGIDYRDHDKPVDLYYEAFGDSSINFVVRFWIAFAKQTDYLQARSDAIMRIKQAFDEGGITIPFPIRTLDFGVVGGEKLNEVLPQRLYEQPGNGLQSS